MFCTNCGNKLPEGSKFCPNCGARILTEITGAAAETAEVLASAEEAVAERVEEIMETAEELAGNAGETVADAVDDAAQAAEEAAGTAEAVFDEAAGAAEETAEKAADAFEEVLEENAGTVEETAEAVTETVENTFGEAAEAADEAVDFVEETAEEAAEKVEEALDEVTGAIEETAEEAAGAAGDAPAEAAGAVALAADQAVEEAEEVIRSADETAEQTAEAAAGFTSDVEAVLTAEVPVSLPDASADTVPETAAAEVSPFASQPVPAAENKAPKKRNGLKVFLALLLIAALAVGGYFVYQNLPAQKVKRYKEAASEAIAAGDLLEASVQYKNALDIEPADEESISALLMMHNMIRQDAVDAAQMGLYAEAVEQMKLANSILIEPEEKNLQDLADIYYEWVGVLAYSGDEEKANTVLASAKADGISADNISLIEENLKRFAGLHRTEAHLEEVSGTLVDLNEQKNYAEIFGIMEEEAADIAAYHETYGGSYPIVSIYENGTKAVIWNFNMDRDAIQVYIGDINSEAVQNGVGDTYYKKGIFKDSVEYEFFSSEWKGGQPNGQFTEISFNGEPDVPSDENSTMVTGTVKDGHYDGDIQNRRNGKVFNMKFDNGKVIVLDTVDPNGEESNVVGYTDDQNTWIYWNDEARLSGTYGLRYII
jgi:uncharacterized Zn finger protein (UPF0148 family)